MSAVALLAKALPMPGELPETPVEGVCCVLGTVGPTIDREWAIKPSCTTLDLLAAPDSRRVSVAAWKVLNTPEERKSSWVCDGETFLKLDRKGVRSQVFAFRGGVWSGYATTSYKKHGALLAPVNSGGTNRWLFEMRVVDCTDRAQVEDTWNRLRAAQDAGIARPLIECLDIDPSYMAKIGWRVWRDFHAWAVPRRNAPLYQFLTYLLPSQEELKEINELVRTIDGRGALAP